MGNKTEVIDTTPSFTIQLLLHQMPAQNFTTNEFMSESIPSKYFTHSEFLKRKFSSSRIKLGYRGFENLIHLQFWHD